LASALATRIATGIVLIGLVLAALLLLPALAFGAILLLIVLAAANEWAKLIGLSNVARAVFVIAVLAAGGVLLGLGARRGFDPIVPIVCGVATLFWIAVGVPSVLRNWQPASVLMRAVCAFVMLEGAFVAIAALQARSPWLALAAMAIVWLADTVAYFAGRRFGRRKLAPQISPRKTWWPCTRCCCCRSHAVPDTTACSVRSRSRSGLHS
jgi:phosphatidate cytidylyltransferase